MDLIELKASATQSNTHPWELARLEFIANRLRYIKKQRVKRGLTEELNVMDAGCGDAFVVSELAKIFSKDDFCGYDPFFEQEVLDLLRERYSDVKNLQLADQLNAVKLWGQVSVVTLLDVIEHIPDDVAALKELRAHPSISTDTQFVITVPAYQHLFSQHDVFMKHFRRYDRKMLHDHLAQAGFEVLESRYFFFSLLLPRWLQVRAEKKNGEAESMDSGEGVSNWSHGRVLTGLVRSTLILDWKITETLRRFGIKLPGLSLYCICRPAAS